MRPAISSVRSYSATLSNCIDTSYVSISHLSTPPTLDSTQWQSCSTAAGSIVGELPSPSTDGEYTLYLYAKDAAGNISESSTLSFHYDTTAPNLTFDTILSGSYRGEQSVDIDYSTSDLHGISSLVLQYSLNGTDFTTVSALDPEASLYTWVLPSVDSTTVYSRIVSRDNATPYNESLIAQGPFTIDSTPPAPVAITFHHPSNTPAISSVPDLSFTTSTCADRPYLFVSESSSVPDLAHSDWQACVTSPGGIVKTLTGPVLEQAHSLYIFARDAVGNISASTNLSVIYDQTPPTLALLTDMSGPFQGGASVNLDWSSTDTNGLSNVRIEYAQNGVDYALVQEVAPPTSNYNWTLPAHDTTSARIRIQSYDNALPVNSTTLVTAPFEIDSTPPALTIASPAAETYHQSSVTVTGQCEIGRPINFGGAILESFSTSCTTGSYSQSLSFTSGDGAKTITIAQTDQVGNTTSLSRLFYRDETPPILTRNSGSNPALSNTNTYTWGGTCEDNFPIQITGSTTTVINCNSGSWSFTTPSFTTDGTRSFALTQTDAAGNTSSPPLGLTWTRDTTPPLFNASNPISLDNGETKTLTNNLNQLSFNGSCEETNVITVSGEQSSTFGCSASSWNFTTATVSTDGTRSYTFTQTNPAGNQSSFTLNWVRDTTGPALTVSQMMIKNNQNSATFTGTCENDLTVSISGPGGGSTSCVGGTWSFATGTQTTDGLRSFTISQTRTVAPFNSTEVDATWLRKTTLPTFTNVTTSSPDPSPTPFIPISVSAQSNHGSINITHLCVRSNTTTAPNLGHDCWLPINSPIIGHPLSPTVSISDYSYLLGWIPRDYEVTFWIKDEALNISSLTSAGTGTVGIDRIDIDYFSASPPFIADVVAANSDSTAIPPTRSETEVPPGSDVYIRWKTTNSDPLPSDAVSIFFTTDDVNLTAIGSAQALHPHSNHGCPSIDLDPNEGCYRWVGGSPLSSAYKIVVRVRNAEDITAQATSNLLNSARIKVLSGNTDIGIGGSVQAATFTAAGNVSNPDVGKLVFTNTGRLFYADPELGILTVNNETGNLEVYIARTGSSTGDGGSAENATVTRGVKITLDYEGRLLIFDNNRIRRVDLNQENPTIETIIGGGSDTSDTVNNPLNLSIVARDSNWDSGSHAPFFAMANGNIIFMSDVHYHKSQNVFEYPRLRIYEAATGRIISRRLTGNGDWRNPTQDPRHCLVYGIGFSFDLTSSQFTGVTSGVRYHPTYPDCDEADYAGRAYYDPETFETISSPNNYSVWSDRNTYTGMDGNLYLNTARARISKFDPVTMNWTTILGVGGTRGECPDGTPATSCHVHISNLFVSETGRIYFYDRGSIRHVDDDGNVITIFGQKTTYGDGVLAVNGRFGDVTGVTLLDNGKIVVADSEGYYYKEFSVEGNIDIIAGSGNEGTTPLNAVGIGNNITNPRHSVVNKTNGEIYTRRGNTAGIIRLNRSTGQWELAVGHEGGGGIHYTVGDGEAGSDISASGDLNRSLPFSFGDNKLLLYRMHRNNDPVRWEDVMIKAYDRGDNYRQHHYTGTLGFMEPAHAFCDEAETGTSGATCMMDHWDRQGKGEWDDINNQWIFANVSGSASSIRRVYSYNPVSGIINQIARTPVNIQHWYLYIQHAPDQRYIYYCSAGRIRRFSIDTQSDSGILPWSMANLNCKGYSASYNPANNSIIFAFEQNGLNGVAEYFID